MSKHDEPSIRFIIGAFIIAAAAGLFLTALSTAVVAWVLKWMGVL